LNLTISGINVVTRVKKMTNPDSREY
jgi:hypothetical protein